MQDIKERLKEMGLFNFRKIRLRRDLTAAYSCWQDIIKMKSDFAKVRRGKDYNLECRKFQQNIRKIFFLHKVDKHYYKFLKEAVEPLSLKILKIWQNKTEQPLLLALLWAGNWTRQPPEVVPTKTMLIERLQYTSKPSNNCWGSDRQK